MADTGIWQPLLTTMTALATPFLTAFLPRFWQDDLRQLQLESETRVKRLDALEKALSTATKAKAELGIEVTTHDLQSELQRIVHEFAGPAVLSREALEHWGNRPLLERLAVFPRGFTVPIEWARAARVWQNLSRICIFCICAYYPALILVSTINTNIIFEFANFFPRNLRNPALVFSFVPLYFLSLYILFLFGTFRICKGALKKLRGMPESETAEVKAGPVAAGSRVEVGSRDDPSFA